MEEKNEIVIETKEKIVGMTFDQRNEFIEAGLDSIFCTHPDPQSESAAYMAFVRKQQAWINDNMLHYDTQTTASSVIELEATKILKATVFGEEEAIKNS